MKMNFMIKAMARVSAQESCESLDEKRIVPKMMLRRRLTRSARIMVYLADACGFSEGPVVYGSAYGEMKATADIVGAIAAKEAISPTAFQNSVYNTAPSYFSLLHGNKKEVITVSSGDRTSANVLQTGALQAVIKEEEVLLVCCEAINIPNIDEVNSCTDYLESGVALILVPTQQAVNTEVVEKEHKGYAPSLWAMLDLFDACDGRTECVVALEL
ncbi:MAG: beta-ketoacyl synthase chain length factor [Thiovulaceae bacterium]|nr:beta-ketoacyl synthase chain length factor [Sulfurimonadaceae bacterium]